jgi:hypothetical protein
MEEKDFYKGYYYCVSKEENEDFDFANSPYSATADQYLSRGNVFKLADKKFYK